jgi:hypothetical protein
MNDYTSIADLDDLYVTDTRDHAFWTRYAQAAELASPRAQDVYLLAPLWTARLRGTFASGEPQMRVRPGGASAGRDA